MKKNIFRSQTLFECDLEYLEIVDCSFTAGKQQYLDKDTEKQHYQLEISEINISSLHIENNTFSNSDFENVFSLDMYKLETENLYMYKNKMFVMDISFAEIEKSLLIDSLYVEKYIGIQNLDFPETNTNIPWNNFGGEKLSIFVEVENDILWPYQAKNDEQLSDNLLYNDLLSAYTKLNTLYHDRGDITSANASYVEIKDLETRRQAYIQSINPSLNNYINYNLNVFLKFFSDYATNPGKSLKLSLWAILIFTGLYMIFFSSWDKINFNFLVVQYDRLSLYISSDKKIHEVYINKGDDKLVYKNIKHKYLKSKKKVPRLLKIFGKFIFCLGNLRHNIIPNLLRLFNFQSDSWESITSPWQKTKSVLIITLITILFLAYILIVKFFNSFILSINSFFVIGFGALPEEDEGIAMYLSIIEGIIGWFLLTIFTITLLSQVLQSV